LHGVPFSLCTPCLLGVSCSLAVLARSLRCVLAWLAVSARSPLFCSLGSQSQLASLASLLLAWHAFLQLSALAFLQLASLAILLLAAPTLPLSSFRALTNATRLDFAAAAGRRRVGVCELVLPEVTDSDYFRANPGSRERIPWVAGALFGAVSSDEAADAVAEAIHSGRPRVWGAGSWERRLPFAALSWVFWLAPLFSDWLSSATGIRAGEVGGPGGEGGGAHEKDM
jgi:hypothetical protein